MAIMHMLKNEEIDSDVILSKNTEKAHIPNTKYRNLLYLIIGILLIYFAFKMMSTALCFIPDLILGSNKNLSLMPSWMKWAAKLGKQFDGIMLDVKFHDLSYRPSGLLGWFIYLIILCCWAFNKVVIIFIANIAIFLFGRIIALLPILLILAIGILGFYLLSEAIFLYDHDRNIISSDEEQIRERGKEGEQIAEKQLKGLPDDYHVFGNLQFEYRNSHGELRPGEADFLVVGPTGLHLVEVKHWTGSISNGSSNKVVIHTKTDGISIEEKSPFYQAMSNSGKLGNQLRHFTNINTHINANVFFTDDNLEIDMQIPANCSAYKIGEQILNQHLTQAICQNNGSTLMREEIEQIVTVLYNDIWKPEFSPEVLLYLRKY